MKLNSLNQELVNANDNLFGNSINKIQNKAESFYKLAKKLVWK
jgi:hypothetical protein